MVGSPSPLALPLTYFGGMSLALWEKEISFWPGASCGRITLLSVGDWVASGPDDLLQWDFPCWYPWAAIFHVFWLGQRSLRPMGTINFQAYVICYGGVPHADTIWPHIMSLWWRRFLELVWKEKLVLVTYFQRWSPLISLASVAKIIWGCYWGSCSIWGRNEPTWFPCVTRLGVNYDRPGSTSVRWEILRCPADVPFLKSMAL